MANFWATPLGGDGTLWKLKEGSTDLFFTCVGVDGDDDFPYVWRPSTTSFARLVSEDTPQSKYAQINMPSNATVTTIATVSTPVIVAGTWTADLGSEFTTTTAGRITYTGTKTLYFYVYAGMEGDTSTGANINFTMFFAKNGTVITDTGITDRLDASDLRYFSNKHIIQLATNDYLESYVQNDVNDTDITMQKATFGLSPLPIVI